MMIGVRSAKDPATVVIAINIIDMTTDELKYYREKYDKIGDLIERLEICQDYREALLQAIDRKLPAFLEHKTNYRSLNEPIPMSEDLAHWTRIKMIEELDAEIKILHNALSDKLL